MQLKDIRIATQLRLGLGLLLVLVVAVGALAWDQSHRLWLGTQTIYNHPLQLSNAVDNLKWDILAMRLEFRNMLLADTPQERQTALANSNVHQADAERQFQVLEAGYTGPREDLQTAHEAFVRWVSTRASNRELAQSKQISQAMGRVSAAGDIGVERANLLAAIAKINAFEKNRADRLYQDASARFLAVQRQLILTVTIFSLGSMIISWLLLKGIKDPLHQLTAVTKQFRQGRLDVRSAYASANEFGELSASFNTMAEAIQTEVEIKEKAVRLSSAMLQEDEVPGFCRELLKSLLQQTESQVGAIYFLNEAKTAFELFDSIGLDSSARAAFSATDLEGELGAALATRQIQRISNIPTDTRFTFASVGGDFKPREILTIPVPSDHAVAAVISLASIHAYDPATLRLVNEVWQVLTARVNGVLAFRKIRDLATRLEHQNQELDAQKRELASQANELAQQNTELERQSQQLNEANRLKSSFLSNMSHELRTPLNSVIALAGVLNRRLEKTIPDEEHSYLEVIERNGKNLLTLINDILDLSRIEAGREEILVSRFSLGDVVGEIVAMIEPQAREKHITLSNLVPVDLPLLTTDSRKLLHILQNLVGNAVKFTESGSVEISAQQAGREFLVAVRDTGIGIAADQLPHIFDEFRQADDGPSRKFGGTGLGLAIAKKYARLLGGEITVASEPGRGSTFTLRLPLEIPGTLSAAQDLSPAPSPQGIPLGQGQSLLVVEDSEPAIIQLTDILVPQGYRLRVARSGKEALAQIEQALPDAMILDLMMPEVDGFQVLQAVRAMERAAHLPVLILTAKQVTQAELSFLKGNHIHQLIQKGNINQRELLMAVATMVALGTGTAATPKRRPRPTGEQRPPKGRGKPVVLVVEDNPDSLLTAKVLLDEHYQVLEAADGRAGLDLASKHLPDLILMDIAMPVMDGIQALQALRQDENLRHIPVIALTASAMKGDRETILAHGFDDYLAKPLEAEQLNRVLRQCLD